MQVAPKFEQTSISAYAQGLYVCNSENSVDSFEEDFLWFALDLLIQIVFGYYFTVNVGGATIYSASCLKSVKKVFEE